jgi:hypothetical protein
MQGNERGGPQDICPLFYWLTGIAPPSTISVVVEKKTPWGDSMETIMLVLLVLFVAIGLLPVGASVPLMRRWVKPNRWYGVRTPKTMSNERMWYDANAYAGELLLGESIVLIAAAVVFYFLCGTNWVAYSISYAVVVMSSTLLRLFLSSRHLRSL